MPMYLKKIYRHFLKAKKIIVGTGFCILIYIISSFKSEPTLGELLASQFKNEIYNNFDTLQFNNILNRTIDSLSPKFKHSNTIRNFYATNGFSTNLVVKFYGNQKLDSLVLFLSKSSEHGVNPEIFSTKDIDSLLKELKANKYTNVNQSYATLAKLELLTANAYISYVSILKFGLVDPRTIHTGYLISLKQPDSLFVTNLLNSVSLTDTLQDVQYKSDQYKALQFAYLQNKNDSVRKILAVNMERLRWALPHTGEEFIQVNIPEFSLVYFNKKDTLTKMKVCVGAKIDNNYEEKYKIFEKSGDYDDKPKNHETPMLFSYINTLYANPVWNIPQSIASSEIYTMASRNRNYLTKNRISVYYRNKLIQNPNQIRWYKYSRDKLPFRFVQQAGENNSLGKFKFSFKNDNSIFLHDTNNKKAFKLSNRAISHGCIRLEKPLKLAELLVFDKEKYEKIRSKIGLAPLDSTKIAQFKGINLLSKPKPIEALQMAFTPKKPIPILITYFTAWEKNNKIEYRPDVYGMDIKLWAAMNNILTPNKITVNVKNKKA